MLRLNEAPRAITAISSTSNKTEMATAAVSVVAEWPPMTNDASAAPARRNCGPLPRQYLMLNPPC
jgi:hypothetical protein